MSPEPSRLPLWRRSERDARLWLLLAILAILLSLNAHQQGQQLRREPAPPSS